MTTRKPPGGTIESLHGLRGLAALLVFVSHSANQGLAPSFLGNGLGQTGVMLFFLLSGFLMALLYLPRQPDRSALVRFAIARAARVLPLYLATIAASAVIVHCLDSNFHYQLDAQQTVRALLLIEAPFELWTLPVEIQFYVVFMMLWMAEAQRAAASKWVWIAAGCTLPSVLYWLTTGSTPLVFPLFAPAFLLGMLIGIHRASLQRALTGRRLDAIALISAAAFALNLPALRLEWGLVLGSGLHLRTWGDPLTGLIVIGIFIAATLEAPTLAFLKSRLLMFCGQISFGFYLFHYPILKYCSALQAPEAVRFALALATTTGLAWLSLTCFERPIESRLRAQLNIRCKNGLRWTTQA